uniref:Clusterin n=1 Tax=Lates calcarifer TaxID=8187 RepID=A0A4W6CH59_LATCA
MRALLLQILCITLSEVVLSAADSSQLGEDILKKLSTAGEQYVDEEIKQALLGVKQVKEMMEKKEEKHRHLMDALTHSSDKKKVNCVSVIKLEEAEQQCQDLTKSSFQECRPCLEDTCKAFYTSTCRRGFASFSFKVEEFFRKMATQLDAAEHVSNQNEENRSQTDSPQNRIEEDKADLDLLYNQSIILVKKMQQVFGPSFLAAFTTELRPSEGGSTAGFLGTTGLDHILDSVYDFGRNMLEEFSYTVADVFEEIEEAEEYFQQSRYMCRRLRRQASECLAAPRLCPSVQQLHSQMEEMHMLLNASRQQYNDRLRLVWRHTADTQRWLSNMDDKYGWVSQLSNRTVGPQNIFNVITVCLDLITVDLTYSTVVMTILDSAPITVVVPADLEVDDPAFIQHAAQEALTLHKQHIRGTDPGSASAA